MTRAYFGLWVLVLGVLSLALFACGGGGSGGSGTVDGTTPQTALQYDSASYDFGYVTQGKSPAPKVVTFTNYGSYAIYLTNISLTGDVAINNGFSLNLNGGDYACGATTQALNAGDKCTVAIGFLPADLGSYSGTLTLTSSDPDNPTMSLTILGESITVGTPKIRINQVEADSCPSSARTVYASVTDQLGYPISGLTVANFALEQTISPDLPPYTAINTLDFVANVSAPISVVLVMDYSSSLTSDPGVVKAMEDGVSYFVNQLSSSDEAALVKFATRVEVVQPFTLGDLSGKIQLLSKITEAWDGGIYTHVYDALYRAVTEAAGNSNQRRAVIVLSDGVDKPGDVSTNYTLQQVIDHASSSGVPLFSIGIGDTINRTVLIQLSNGSGGQFYDVGVAGPLVADNLRTIYQQQAKILFVDQYVLTYDSIFSAGTSAELTAHVSLDSWASYEFDTQSISPCP